MDYNFQRPYIGIDGTVLKGSLRVMRTEEDGKKYCFIISRREKAA
jgi:hypothetical protein